MKTKPVLFLLSLPVAASLSAQNAPVSQPPAPSTQQSEQLTPGSILAAQIRAIVSDRDLSERAKARQIASAIRLAINTVTTNLQDVELAQSLILDLATQAAQAAPTFAALVATTVETTVANIPLLANTPTLTAKVQAAVDTGVKAAAAAAGVVSFDTSTGDNQNTANNTTNNTSNAPAKPIFNGSLDATPVSPATR